MHDWQISKIGWLVRGNHADPPSLTQPARDLRANGRGLVCTLRQWTKDDQKDHSSRPEGRIKKASVVLDVVLRSAKISIYLTIF